jgi:hypothetical protein
MRPDASGYPEDMSETPERDPEDRLHDDEIDQLPEGFVPDPLNELDGPEEEPPHLQGGSPHDNQPAPYDEPNPEVP